MTARLLVEHAEDGHGRGRLDQDDSVEDQVAEAQGALESDRFGLCAGRWRPFRSSACCDSGCRRERDGCDVPAIDLYDGDGVVAFRQFRGEGGGFTGSEFDPVV